MNIKDIKAVINENLTKIIYENHYTGQQYECVDENTTVVMIIPIDDKTITIFCNP